MLNPLYPDFKVDQFNANKSGYYSFFLSHNHEDHLGGLTAPSRHTSYNVPKQEWNYGKIYTSEVSAKLLLHRFPHLAPYTIPLKCYTDYHVKGRQVTLLEANHCPGATMFLIKGPIGTILHTGDFRYHPRMLD